MKFESGSGSGSDFLFSFRTDLGLGLDLDLGQFSNHIQVYPCRRLEQRREAPTEHEAREVILRCTRYHMRHMEQRCKTLNEREAREVILRGIDAQCNKRSPLVTFKIKFFNSTTKFLRELIVLLCFELYF